MSVRLIPAVAALVLLGACATTQENPYYSQSTQYKGDTPQQNTTYAQAHPSTYNAGTYSSGQTVSAATPIVVVQEMPASIQTGTYQPTSPVYTLPASQPASQVYTQTSPAQTVNQERPIYVNHAHMAAGNAVPAPTDQHYGETIGTPGYHAMMAAQAAELAEEEALLAEREATTYRQAHTVTARSELSSSLPSFASGESLHEVIEGNTVYSLSRSRCVSVDEIQQLNQLDGAYSIRLGDQIRLPASRC